MFTKLLCTAIFAVLALGQGAAAVPQAGIVLCGGPYDPPSTGLFCCVPGPVPVGGNTKPMFNKLVSTIILAILVLAQGAVSVPQDLDPLCVQPTLPHRPVLLQPQPPNGWHTPSASTLLEGLSCVGWEW
ncbi:hypothetical protein C8R44DRAFT_882596 [Mycena epipterygia]|nr:hypothetical protein C8R44DRAFT_882596 [Mycena epipterygia]